MEQDLTDKALKQEKAWINVVPKETYRPYQTRETFCRAVKEEAGKTQTAVPAKDRGPEGVQVEETVEIE